MNNGDMLFVKTSFLFGCFEKDTKGRYEPIRAFSYLFLFEQIEDKQDKNTTILHCLYKGKQRFIPVANERLSQYFSVIKIPKNDNYGDVTDLWITKYMNVYGKPFYYKNNKINIYKGKYPNKECLCIEHKLGEYNEPFIGLNIKRSASNRKLIFEFLYKNQICWKDFSNLKKSKNNFDKIFLRLIKQ